MLREGRLTTDRCLAASRLDAIAIEELFCDEWELVLFNQSHLDLHVLLVSMVEVGQLKGDLVGVVIRRVSTIVLLPIFLDPLGDLELGLAALGLHKIVLLHVDVAIDEGKFGLFLTLFGFVRPEVLDFALLDAFVKALHTRIVVFFGLLE